MSSIDQVKAVISNGISRPTLFRLIIPGISTPAQDQLSVLCKTAKVPEISLSSIAVNGQDSQGVTREQPARVVYANPFTITVIADRDYTVYDALREWFQTSSLNSNPFVVEPDEGIVSTSQNQKIGYYDSLVRNLILEKLEYMSREELDKKKEEDEIYFSPFRVQFNNAHIARIGELGLDSQMTDTMMEFTVDFAYETYSYIRDDIIVRDQS